MKALSALLKASLIGLAMLCLALALNSTGTDEKITIDETTLYLLLFGLSALGYGWIATTEYMLKKGI
ncbi:MAG TPA: hypothetical protein DCP63_10620 [Bacteroidetes bacterium]|nr:hypothetical protein [Bacteroidota bacterium]